ncbi:Z1 domain-containing protein [Peribacillus frigoritolerans]|uniref:Z1 domain-containing protein n=1 Tax=Peribacillus frigoritolerans TaxID=450367 RepID=UPI003CFFCA58
MIKQMVSNYELIKEYIYDRLEKAVKPLEVGEIEKVVAEVQGYMSILTPELAAGIIAYNKIESLERLTEDEWSRMTKDFKMHFDVTHERGTLVNSAEQRKRDLEWWTRDVKKDIDTYHWSRYKKYISQTLPYEVVKTIDDDTDVVMNNLANPHTESQFSRYGMVVGHVQSGKTGNYSALVSKAADAGYKFIVVIAGGLNNLRNQTQERLNESFIGREGTDIVGVGNFANSDRKRTPVSLTTKITDFNKSDATGAKQGLDLDMGDRPVILVIKKNTRTLSNVIDWLKSHYQEEIKDHAMLLIDDESDYASINTKDENDPTSINKKIRELISLFRKSAYIAYTATPYANIFIDYKAETKELGKDLFPEDFIYALEAPTNYFGAAKIFLDPTKKHWVKVDDHLDIIPANHKKDLEIEELPESLEDAIRLFTLNVAIRHLRRQEDKHNSMMVHVTRFTKMHHKIYLKVSEYMEKLQQAVVVHGSLDSSSNINKYIEDLKATFDKNYSALEFNWKTVLAKMTEVIELIDTREVHKDKKQELIYPKEKPVHFIVVGGTSLARGYTLEGLSISYFLRTTVLYDTLMQMGRWFGYRTNFEDLCKIYMTETTFNSFTTIIEATLDLVDNLQKMSRLNLTPRDFGLAVQQHPDSGLQVTARNKLKQTKDIYFEMKLDGHLKETSWIPANESETKHNIQAIEALVVKLGQTNSDKKKPEIWKGINKDIVIDFLENFKFYAPESDEFGMYSRMPVNFVKAYAKDINTSWDIVLYKGNSQEDITINGRDFGKQQERQLDIKGDRYEFRNRQVSSGNAEEVTLSKDDIKDLNYRQKQKKEAKEKRKNGQIEEDKISKRLEEFSRRKAAREKLIRPLLMLHLIDAKLHHVKHNIVEDNKKVAAFSISFPTSIESGNRNVKLKVNKVYLDILEKSIVEQGDQDDDDID